MMQVPVNTLRRCLKLCSRCELAGAVYKANPPQLPQACFVPANVKGFRDINVAMKPTSFTSRSLDISFHSLFCNGIQHFSDGCDETRPEDGTATFCYASCFCVHNPTHIIQ